MKFKNKWLVRLLMVFGLAVGGVTAACNTVEGAGEDVESAGESLSEASRDARR